MQESLDNNVGFKLLTRLNVQDINFLLISSISIILVVSNSPTTFYYYIVLALDNYKTLVNSLLSIV